MDWQVVEKLAQALAWPIVALIMFLIALPVFYARLGKLIEAVLAIRDLPKTMQDTIKEHERLTAQFKQQVTNANSEIDETAKKVQALVTDLGAIRSELQAIQTEAQEEALTAENRAMPVAASAPNEEPTGADLNAEQMYITALGKWTNFMRVLENRLRDADIPYDMRRVGQAAYALMDRRRRAYLTREEAELITSLSRQARRFNRLADSKEQWLTPEFYQRFVTGVDTAFEAISRQKTVSPDAPVAS